MEFKKSDYSFRGDNRITLTDDLVNEIKDKFSNDRENRFQIFCTPRIYKGNRKETDSTER